MAVQELTVDTNANAGLHSLGDFMLLHGPPHWWLQRATGILFRSTLLHACSQFWSRHPHVVSLMYSQGNTTWRIVGAHLPHSQRPQEEFLATLTELETHLRCPARHHVLLLDANTQLEGPQAFGSIDERGAEVTALLERYSMHACNTHGEESHFTWTSWTDASHHEQIDFICADVPALNTGVAHTELRTDHCLVHSELGLLAPRQGRQSTLWGFNPRSTTRYMAQQQLGLIASRPTHMDEYHDQIGLVAQQHVQRIPPDWVPADLERPRPT
eukprot:4620392-Amphidinium_carterae.1